MTHALSFLIGILTGSGALLAWAWWWKGRR